MVLGNEAQYGLCHKLQFCRQFREIFEGTGTRTAQIGDELEIQYTVYQTLRRNTRSTRLSGEWGNCPCLCIPSGAALNKRIGGQHHYSSGKQHRLRMYCCLPVCTTEIVSLHVLVHTSHAAPLKSWLHDVHVLHDAQESMKSMKQLMFCGATKAVDDVAHNQLQLLVSSNAHSWGMQAPEQMVCTQACWAPHVDALISLLTLTIVLTGVAS
eukprot:1161677-Pelagomonas_calceolata.AAC.14